MFSLNKWPFFPSSSFCETVIALKLGAILLPQSPEAGIVGMYHHPGCWKHYFSLWCWRLKQLLILVITKIHLSAANTNIRTFPLKESISFPRENPCLCGAGLRQRHDEPWAPSCLSFPFSHFWTLPGTLWPYLILYFIYFSTVNTALFSTTERKRVYFGSQLF